jgi:hypothetical protein
MVRNFSCTLLSLKSADLYSPLSTRIQGQRRSKQLNADFSSASANQANFFRRGPREVNDTAFYKWPTVGDADNHRLSRTQICNSHNRAERECAVRGSQRVHVVDFAIRSAAIVIGGAIPTRDARFDEQRLCIGRNFRLRRNGCFWNFAAIRFN